MQQNEKTDRAGLPAKGWIFILRNGRNVLLIKYENERRNLKGLFGCFEMECPGGLFIYCEAGG